MSKGLYRDTENARIAGVCGGVANYFDLEPWLVRILAVTAFFLLAGPFMFIGYIACWFILEPKPAAGSSSESEASEQRAMKNHWGKGWRNSGQYYHHDSSHKVAVKTKVWQAGEPPKQAFHDIAGRFKDAELRLRKMEKYVTSKEFQLNREISRL
ncbi:envelope stress response membrane protein PspC [Alteromonas sp. C1M14]|uniref:envelope stress response membrane protein PspC n=1 Tax=Alteromonas sp. C1M14 TaxID=2841567 RepID=UPI001C08AF62|nr:envelope stress response membrane protein PspC [Alteromonas sp. C1M14]MBU2978016.1 envelope stress response membrane protein PspC [Alteromonas sp. C1M14]